MGQVVKMTAATSQRLEMAAESAVGEVF